MCGISGIFSLSHFGIEDQLHKTGLMSEAQAHRGPDDEGTAIISREAPGLTFGHRRLSIIDTSPAGHQPMRESATGNWIIFNGEIYNYRELRDDLIKQGIAFSTQTDTEVILKAYRVWGVDCVRQFRGIFAFALWDENDKALILARDHMGVKPLYFWENEDKTLVFASEVRALLASGMVPGILDYKALRSYLAYGSVQEPYTLVKGVVSLPPGHVMVCKDGEKKAHRYWEIPAQKKRQKMDVGDLLVQIGAQLKDSVKSQLIADVPLGAFLSGGIDSTAIAALMRDAALGEVKTFSIVFDEKSHDERTYSRMAAKHIGSSHTELNLRGEDVRDMLEKSLYAFDQPSMDGLNTYFVSKITKEAGLTVALSGVGGDELFAGYNGFTIPLMAENWGRYVSVMPLLLRTPIGRILSGMPVNERVRRFADLLVTKRHPYFLARQVFSQSQSRGLLNADIYERSDQWEPGTFSQLEKQTSKFDPVNRASAMELQTYMLSTLLRDTDQMSMAHALEVRVPLIDHKLVEFMFSLPGEIKINKKIPKPMLTRSLNGSIPDGCVFRPKKGFELPFASWFRESLSGQLTDSFNGQSEEEAWPFQAAALENTYRSYQKGLINWSRIWTIFVLRHWLKTHNINK
ncbi:MAG: asparagine synthase (glutamine-hydrolyzing) [Balneolales bacterium]